MQAVIPGCGSGRGPLLANSHEHFDARLLGAGRQGGADLERDIFGRDVGELAGVDIEEVMMRLDTRVVELPRRVDVDRAEQAPLAKEIERVVDGRLRHVRAVFTDGGKNLLRRHMLRTRHEQARDLEALSRWLNTVLHEQVGKLFLFHSDRTFRM
jgi:hypothetical protein